MIYAVALGSKNRVRGYYTEEKLAQEHADFINNAEKTITYRKPLTARVIEVEQERDKEAVKPFFEALGGVPWRLCCGSCGRIIAETDADTGKEAMELFEQFKYCPYCGKRVKWE